MITGSSFGDENESTMGDRLTFIPLLTGMEGNQEFMGGYLSFRHWQFSNNACLMRRFCYLIYLQNLPVKANICAPWRSEWNVLELNNFKRRRLLPYINPDSNCQTSNAFTILILIRLPNTHFFNIQCKQYIYTIYYVCHDLFDFPYIQNSSIPAPNQGSQGRAQGVRMSGAGNPRLQNLPPPPNDNHRNQAGKSPDGRLSAVCSLFTVHG